MCAASSSCSNAVSEGNSSAPWNTMPICSRRRRVRADCDSPAASVPATTTVPASGVRSMPATASRVDLPEPDRPEMVTSSPGATDSAV